MLRRLAAFIFILGHLQGFLSQKVQVFQVPEVHAASGSDVTLPCTYNISGVETTIGSYKWYRHLVRNGLEVSNSNKDFTGRISRVDGDLFINTRSAQITIHNVSLSDAGTYYCEVTFLHPGDIFGHGAGTLLNVTGFLSQEVQVFQVPEVHATSGSNATLPCTYNISGAETTIGTYKWYRHLVRSEVSNSNKDFTGRISRAARDLFIINRSAQITIHNVSLSDADTYYCEVTFLHGGEISGHGAGTLLNVTDVLESPSPYKTPYIIILRTVLGVVVVVLLAVGSYRISRQGSRQSGRRGPEMPQDAETGALHLSGDGAVQCHTIEETPPPAEPDDTTEGGAFTCQKLGPCSSLTRENSSPAEPDDVREGGILHLSAGGSIQYHIL